MIDLLNFDRVDDAVFNEQLPPSLVLAEMGIEPDWQARLVALCQQANDWDEETAEQFATCLLRHRPENTGYPGAAAMALSLQTIYARLAGKFAAPFDVVSTDEIRAVSLRLFEVGKACHSGLHAYANQIVQGYKLPSSIAGLLTSARVGLIQQLALAKHPQNIHARSYYHHAARAANFGVPEQNDFDIAARALNPDDVLADIRAHFDAHYQAGHLPGLLMTALRSTLAHFGYKGAKAGDSYAMGESAAFLALLSKVFNASLGRDWLVIDDDAMIVDVNWPMIERELTFALADQGFIQPGIEPEREKCANRDLRAARLTRNIEAHLVPTLAFDGERHNVQFASMFAQLKAVPVINQAQIINSIMSFILSQQPALLENLFQFIQEFNPSSVPAFFTFHRDNAQGEYLREVFAKYPQLLDTMQRYFPLLSDGQQQQVLTMENEQQDNGLMHSLRHNVALSAPLLTMLNAAPRALRQACLTRVDRDGCNALQLAIMHTPSAVMPILSLMQSLPREVRAAILAHTNQAGLSALPLASRANHPLLFIIDELAEQTLSPEQMAAARQAIAWGREAPAAADALEAQAAHVARPAAL